ncbi:MAG: hypothetical protein EXS16_11960 [Gemmataceae bacterium]|nr:hypothetical protein [Gemmataceae bacterium]
MHAKLLSLVLVLTLFPITSRAQESDRNLKGSGQSGAFLTPGQIDRWSFNGEKGETIIVHVASKEFDPLLGLTKAVGKKDETVIADVDDLGTESRFMIRLPDKGTFKIRVRAFKDQAGGNYKLNVRRFQATPLEVGKSVVGTFDDEGMSHHFFKGVKDQILVPQLKGSTRDAWSLLDFKGREMDNWAGSVRIDETGECCLVVSGPVDYRYDLLVREARRQELAIGKNLAAKLEQGAMDVLSFQGKPGDFRLFEIEKKGVVSTRLIFAPEDKSSEPRIERRGARVEIAFLPVASRGGYLRYAAILGRSGQFQFQLLASTTASYTLNARDPSVSIDVSKAIDGDLPVGGAAFYSFKAAPGQLVHANLASQKFVPLLRLYDARGKLVSASGGDGDELQGRFTHMIVSEGLYRLQVSSLGDGGGGGYQQSLKDIKLKDIAVGGRDKGSLSPGATDFWSFTGKQGQTVILNVRSAAFEPIVSLHSPDGVRLVAGNQGNPATGSLVAIMLPKTGRYTVWVSSSRGAGDYTMRLIDGD